MDGELVILGSDNLLYAGSVTAGWADGIMLDGSTSDVHPLILTFEYLASSDLAQDPRPEERTMYIALHGPGIDDLVYAVTAAMMSEHRPARKEEEHE